MFPMGNRITVVFIVRHGRIYLKNSNFKNLSNKLGLVQSSSSSSFRIVSVRSSSCRAILVRLSSIDGHWSSFCKVVLSQCWLPLKSSLDRIQTTILFFCGGGEFVKNINRPNFQLVKFQGGGGGGQLENPSKLK